VHAWLVAGEEAPPGPGLELVGTVESVGDASFVLATGPAHGGLVTVFVDDATVWGGTLSGIGDLISGMLVYVEGELTPEQTVLAWYVESSE
jgi:hypothetical protein